jgi:hypothetical protein
MPHLSKPGIDRLLVRSALEADLRRRLLESPEEVFQEFDLTEEQQDLLRRPDHRLLPLLGSVLARQAESADDSGPPAGKDRYENGRLVAPAVLPPVTGPATRSPALPGQPRTLPDTSLVLTVVPCARVEDGEPKGYSYAVWVNPLPEGADPANLPPPAGAVLPGQPLAPLHVVIQISAVEVPDASGRPQVGLSASLRQSSNIMGPPSPESAGIPEDSPFGSDLRSAGVEAAVARVRTATREERYDRLIDLIGTLRGGEVR